MSLLAEWLQTKCSANVWVFVKRLSANDTGATKSHQSGLYMPGAVEKFIVVVNGPYII